MPPIRIGVAGACGRGRAYVGAARRHPHVRVAALCDTRDETMEALSRELGDVACFTAYEEMVESRCVDAVVVATPMHLHAPQSVFALDRDLHVLSEVTAAVDMSQARCLVEAARRSAARYMLAENCCYMRHVETVAAMVRDGLFGELTFADGQYLHDCRELCASTPWRRRWHYGVNGNPYGTHNLGPILQWLDDRVTEVACAGSGRHHLDACGEPFGIEDTTVTLCRTERGRLVELRLDIVSPRPPCLAYTLQGTEGVFESARGAGDEHRVALASQGGAMKWRPLAEFEARYLPEAWRRMDTAAAASGHDGSDDRTFGAFVECIASGAPSPIDVHAAMDMTLPGLVSTASIDSGGAWLPVPNSREW